MSTSRTLPSGNKQITPPSSVVHAPLTPPLTDKKPATKVQRILALFNDIKAGRSTHSYPWEEFQLEPGEYDQLEREIRRDKSLLGYIEDKLR
jgi:hypothetical protein